MLLTVSAGALIVSHFPMKPIGLTDQQLAHLKQAAQSLLLPSARDDFLTGVARRLGDAPSDAALQLAIDAQLALGKLPTLLCDSAAGTTKEKIG
jgi:hypothetical protein